MEQSEGKDSTDRPSQITHKASLLVSCFWCERLHAPENPHDFNPVCLACAGTTYRAAAYPMGSLEMDGSYPLSDEAIDEMVRRRSPGNYALGYMDGTTFMVFYVGRSDSDVKCRLHEWVGVPSRYARYAPSTRAAWGSRPRRNLPQGAPALERVGIGVNSSYTRFAYSYAPSPKAAFEKECRNYHGFGAGEGLDNEVHPAPTPGSSGECFAHDQ
jgi:hypothetical protein